MSDVINQPLQLIRFKDGLFQVPQETATFLQQFKNPLGVISIVGKYRSGKSLFLNKVLLKNSTFKVSPTINSCTKGLWMCRQTLKSEHPGEQIDLLVLDTQGFGAPEETDKYNQKILLFAMLLSSYFIYNSVGSIDQNALNSLNLVSQLARQILNSNNKGQRIEDESPFFLWLLRDFALNLQDKNGVSIQAKEYLEQSLQIQKGTSDLIENKNKIRRMLKNFFKERDCFTLVRPVESQQDLQNLLQLPDSFLRTQFLQQVVKLRHKILTRVRSKKIKGKQLDGVMLLQLVKNYVQVVNRGDLPSYQLSYKHIMKHQIHRLCGQFTQTIDKKIFMSNQNMLSREEIEKMQKQLIGEMQTKFKGEWDADQLKKVVEKSSKEIKKAISRLRQQNQRKCINHCMSIWQELFDSDRQFEYEQDIKIYFNDLFQKFKHKMSSSANPTSQQFYKDIVSQHQIKTLTRYLSNLRTQLNQKLHQKQTSIEQFSSLSSQQKIRIKELEESNYKLSKELSFSKSQLASTQELKNNEISHLKQQASKNMREISQWMEKYEVVSQDFSNCRNQLQQLIDKNNQLNKDFSQTGEEKRLANKELQIIRVSLQQKCQQVKRLRQEMADIAGRLEAALEKQSFILQKHQSQIEHKNSLYNSISGKYQEQLEHINSLNIKLKEVQKDLQSNTAILNREKSIYQNMFQSFKESLTLQGNSRMELIQTNKNLSAALKHLEKRTEQAQQKQKQLKDYKKCIKNSSCLQCQHCTKFFVPSVFLPHLNVCLIGPQALKTTKPYLKVMNKPKLQIKVRQTLVRQSAQGKPFTQYVLQFKRNNREWSVTRKYKAFCDLHTSLKSALPGVQFSQVSYVVNPQEASKKSLVIDERRKTLERYLNDLESNPFVSVTPMWADFIEEPDSIQGSMRSSPLKQIVRQNQQQTPQQFFKIWNQRHIRGKESQSIKGKWKM